MGLGVSIFLAAVGAILAFAVTATVSGVDIHTVGWILLIVGIVGLVLSMIFWSSWAGPGYFTSRRRTHVRRRGPRRPCPATRPTPHESVHEHGRPAGRPSRVSGDGQLDRERRAARPSETTQIRPFMRCTSSRQM